MMNEYYRCLLSPSTCVQFCELNDKTIANRKRQGFSSTNQTTLASFRGHILLLISYYSSKKRRLEWYWGKMIEIQFFKTLSLLSSWNSFGLRYEMFAPSMNLLGLYSKRHGKKRRKHWQNDTENWQNEHRRHLGNRHSALRSWMVCAQNCQTITRRTWNSSKG